MLCVNKKKDIADEAYWGSGALGSGWGSQRPTAATLNSVKAPSSSSQGSKFHASAGAASTEAGGSRDKDSDSRDSRKSSSAASPPASAALSDVSASSRSAAEGKGKKWYQRRPVLRTRSQASSVSGRSTSAKRRGFVAHDIFTFNGILPANFGLAIVAVVLLTILAILLVASPNLKWFYSPAVDFRDRASSSWRWMTNWEAGTGPQHSKAGSMAEADDSAQSARTPADAIRWHEDGSSLTEKRDSKAEHHVAKKKGRTSGHRHEHHQVLEGGGVSRTSSRRNLLVGQQESQHHRMVRSSKLNAKANSVDERDDVEDEEEQESQHHSRVRSDLNARADTVDDGDNEEEEPHRKGSRPHFSSRRDAEASSLLEVARSSFIEVVGDRSNKESEIEDTLAKDLPGIVEDALAAVKDMPSEPEAHSSWSGVPQPPDKDQEQDEEQQLQQAQAQPRLSGVASSFVEVTQQGDASVPMPGLGTDSPSAGIGAADAAKVVVSMDHRGRLVRSESSRSSRRSS